MEHQEWLTINYTLPKEPSRVRVSVWRKLKKSGAVILGQSVWFLPMYDNNEAFFQKISAEITLKSSVQNYTIQVRQLGYGPAILVKNPNPIIDAAGGPLSIIVTSNIEYTKEQSENRDWIKTYVNFSI